MSRKRRLFDNDGGPPMKLFEFMPHDEPMDSPCECGAPAEQHILPPTPKYPRKMNAADLLKIAQTYMDTHKIKMGNLNMNTLQKIVQFCNAAPNMRIFVYEESLGVVTMSVAFNMSGVGELTILHNGMNPATFPVLQEVEDLWEFKTLILVRLSSVAQIDRKSNPVPFEKMETDAELMDVYDSATTSNNTPMITWTRDAFLQDTVLDSIIIVANIFNPVEILTETYKKLVSGGRIIVYSNDQPKINDVFAFLVGNDTQELQLHPQEDIGLTTGYLITAIKA